MSDSRSPQDDFRAPRTPDELHRWLQRMLDLDIPRGPVPDGHAAPFDYLCHAFFERPGPRDCIVWANRGGGKTFLGAVATALDLLFKPGIQVRILAGSLEQAQRMHAHLRGLFEKPALAPKLEGRVTERRLRTRDGSVAELLAASQASVRGTRVQRLRCDEVELFDPALWEAAQLTTRSARCGDTWVRGSVECLSTMHVPHGLMSRLVADAAAGRRRLFKWGVVDVLETCPGSRTCGECPLEPDCRGRAKQFPGGGGHIAIDDAIAMKERVSALAWESEMLCLRASRSDSVYPEFDHAAHVAEDLPAHLAPGADGPDEGDGPASRNGFAGSSRTSGAPSRGRSFSVYCGMDFGYRSPTVILWAVRDAATDTLWIVGERVVRGVTLREHIRALAGSPWGRPEWIGADPAGEGTSEQTGVSAIDVLRASGFRVEARRLRVAPGLELVRARLKPAGGGPARLRVLAHCRELIRALDTYHYDPRRPDSAEPMKDGPDHAADALRYLIVSLDEPYRAQRGWY